MLIGQTYRHRGCDRSHRAEGHHGVEIALLEVPIVDVAIVEVHVPRVGRTVLRRRPNPIGPQNITVASAGNPDRRTRTSFGKLVDVPSLPYGIMKYGLPFSNQANRAAFLFVRIRLLRTVNSLIQICHITG